MTKVESVVSIGHNNMWFEQSDEAGPTSLSPNFRELWLSDPVTLCKGWRKSKENNQLRDRESAELTAIAIRQRKPHTTVTDLYEDTQFIEENMSRKLYLVISGTIFCLVACLHLLRLIFDWQAQVGTWIIPFWLSWGGLIGASILSAWAFQQTRGK